jgi:hypothetical protein
MKVKEIPLSLYQTIRLRSISTQQLLLPGETLPVIVSLTSFEKRLDVADLPVRSLLAQKNKPEKIILWLHDTLRNKIPKKLSELVGPVFSIEFSDWDSPHLKLVRTLEKYPESLVATVDDDLIYRDAWLTKLYREHLGKPEHIISNQTRLIRYGQDNNVLPYAQWPTNYDPEIGGRQILPIGSAGALYPPGSLDDRFGDVALFLKLAPKADDLWFKAMSLLKGTPSAQAAERPKSPIPIMGSQTVSLKKENIDQDRNRAQWLALTEYFDLKLYGTGHG